MCVPTTFVTDCRIKIYFKTVTEFVGGTVAPGKGVGGLFSGTTARLLGEGLYGLPVKGLNYSYNQDLLDHWRDRRFRGSTCFEIVTFLWILAGLNSVTNNKKWSQIGPMQYCSSCDWNFSGSCQISDRKCDYNLLPQFWALWKLCRK